jgi:hypothetical protein
MARDRGWPGDSDPGCSLQMLFNAIGFRLAEAHDRAFMARMIFPPAGCRKPLSLFPHFPRESPTRFVGRWDRVPPTFPSEVLWL